MTTFRGCGTALVTPMTRDGAVDLDALNRLVDWQIEQGIDFLVPCGSTGEAATLTQDERVQVVSAVVARARGRVPVVAGATSSSTQAVVEEVRLLGGLGVDGLMSATPPYNKPTQLGLERHFQTIADAAPKPLIVYNVPGRTAVNLLARTTLQLARHPNIVAVKEASGDLNQVAHVLAERPEGFSVLSGDDGVALPIIALGGEGLISVVSNEVPRLMTDLVKAAREGDLTRARALHYQVLPLIDANFVETNPSPAKAALALMGRITNAVRLPLVTVAPTTEAALAGALELAGVEVRTR